MRHAPKTGRMVSQNRDLRYDACRHSASRAASGANAFNFPEFFSTGNRMRRTMPPRPELPRPSSRSLRSQPLPPRCSRCRGLSPLRCSRSRCTRTIRTTFYFVAGRRSCLLRASTTARSSTATLSLRLRSVASSSRRASSATSTATSRGRRTRSTRAKSAPAGLTACALVEPGRAYAAYLRTPVFSCYLARRTSFIVPKFSAEYTFHTVSNDGVCLWVNGRQIITNRTDHSTTEDTGKISLEYFKDAWLQSPAMTCDDATVNFG